MKTPTPIEVSTFFTHGYDPKKAHEYYLRTRKLKGREAGAVEVAPQKHRDAFGADPRVGKTKAQIHKDARAKQRAELSQQVRSLEGKLAKVKALISKKKAEADSTHRKSLGKKERAAKEKNKPQTAAEKAKLSRDNKKYRDKHHQKLKTQSKSSNNSRSKKHSDSSGKGDSWSVTDLQILATKVQGQITVAKQKLAAL